MSVSTENGFRRDGKHSGEGGEAFWSVFVAIRGIEVKNTPLVSDPGQTRGGVFFKNSKCPKNPYLWLRSGTNKGVFL